MAIFLLRFLIFLIPTVFVVKQVIMPLLRDDPLFPMFKDKPQLVRNAEDSLLEAEAANKAAEMEAEAARINKETWAMNDKLYKTEIDNDET
jgi:hypothetical protein